MSEKCLYKKDLKSMGFTEAMIRDLLPPPIEEKPLRRGNPTRKKWLENDVFSIMKTEKYAETLAKAEKRKTVSNKGAKTRRNNTEHKLKEFISSVILLKNLSFDELIEDTLNDKSNYIYNRLLEKQSYLERKYSITDSEKDFIMDYERPDNPKYDYFYTYDPNYFYGEGFGAYVENYRQEYQDICYEIEHFSFSRPTDNKILYNWMVNYIYYNLIDYDETLLSSCKKTDIEDWLIAKEERIFKIISETYPELSDECDSQLYKRETKIIMELNDCQMSIDF